MVPNGFNGVDYKHHLTIRQVKTPFTSDILLHHFLNHVSYFYAAFYLFK